MSIRPATAPHRRSQRQQRVPVVMPMVEVTVDGQGSLEVLLDREPYAADRALHRRDLSRVLDDITTTLGTPVRVQIREQDGTTFIDFAAPSSALQEVTEGPAIRTAPVPPGALTGRGFIPGEQVKVAVVVARLVASSNGTARLHLPPALLAAHPGVLVLVGQSSGTIIVGSVPA